MFHKGYERKIDQLVNELTLEEKIKMIHGAGLFRTGAVERLGIPPIVMSDGPTGVRFEFFNDNWGRAGHNDDGVTYCPSNSAIAATWNRELAGKSGTVLGEEARGRGKDIILAPGVNVMRTPLCGRNFEYFSEDPYLISEMAVPVIEGIESSDVGACVKHFAVNNQETERNWVNVEIDERTLREIYLPAFEAAVKKAKVRSIMGAYNLFRGVHCCENNELLGEILRKEWNYDGLIVSDWGGIHDTKAAAESPIDVEMSIYANFDEYCMADPLLNAVRNGEIEEGRIDEKVKSILRFMLRVKMIDIVEVESGDNEQTAISAGCTEQKPAVYAVRDRSRKKGSYDTSAHQDAVLETARESIVLLKNEEQRLPLAPEKTHRLLVIGHNAAKLHSNGGGSAEIAALYEINPLLGIKMELGGNCEVTYAEGYYVPDKNRQQVLNWQEVSLDELASEQGAYEGNDPEGRKIQKALREEAVALASEYDDVIFVGGLNHDTDEEGYDRPDLKLPYHQDELITELLKVNPNMVIVMMAGNPVDMSAWIDDAKSIVWMSYAGMEGGRALGEILFGEVNPSGKLVMTMPKSLDQVPAMVFGDFPGRTLTEEEHERMNAKLTETYREGVFVGYRYYDKYQIPVQFPFGHGLSYTTFSYGDMQVKEPDGQTFKVQIPVTNTGKLAGKETVELYVGETEVSPENPVKELKGFCKLSLAPGETKYAEFELTAEAFRHFDEKTDEWKVVAGSYTIYIGSSVSDIRSVTTITIK